MRSRKTIVTVASLLLGLLLVTACVGAPTCNSEGNYTESREGQRIQAPDDLNDLSSYKEMTIPQASPHTAADETERCLEAPPKLPSGSSS